MGISKSNLKNLWHLWKFFVVFTFLHSDCIQIILISVFSPIPGKYGLKNFWIRIFFTEFRKQRFVWRNTFPILFKTFLVPIKDLSTMEMKSTRKHPWGRNLLGSPQKDARYFHPILRNSSDKLQLPYLAGPSKSIHELDLFTIQHTIFLEVLLSLLDGYWKTKLIFKLRNLTSWEQSN